MVAPEIFVPGRKFASVIDGRRELRKLDLARAMLPDPLVDALDELLESALVMRKRKIEERIVGIDVDIRALLQRLRLVGHSVKRTP